MQSYIKIGTPFALLALYGADQSLLWTLAPFSIILSLILGKYMLKEEIHLNHYIAVTLMIIGSMLAMYFTSKTTHHYTLEDLKRRVLSPWSVTILVVNFSLFITFMISSFFIIRDTIKMSKYFSQIEMKNWLLRFSPTSDTGESIKFAYDTNKQGNLICKVTYKHIYIDLSSSNESGKSFKIRIMILINDK